MSRLDVKKELVQEAAVGMMRVLNEQIALQVSWLKPSEDVVGADLSVWQGDLVILPRFGRKIEHCGVTGGSLETARRAVKYLQDNSTDFRRQFEVGPKNDMLVRIIQIDREQILRCLRMDSEDTENTSSTIAN